jgi:antitoxin (DNA-binding transcriptional repressor) of toxin-antitoxin stability system
MKRLSIQSLRARLPADVAAAEAGVTITITRHNRPVAQLGPAVSMHVHRGTLVGKERLRPAARTNTKGRIFEILDDHRGH